MTPDQIALRAIRQRNSALEALCSTAGKPLYEGRAHRPAQGYKCSVSRQARVFRVPDGRIIVEGVQIWNARFRRVNSQYFEASDETVGQGLADQFLGREFL
ncbi:hypothetical protein A8H39_00570 [Paraburkholderia fungorum]|uniref:hypothetical protein n=1 Tax=Paraburkholderia fungorum TaxID=134537 RepID=UPI000488EC2C|nr:hypothetical protein [Paraburkholderia fungorum]MBB5547374.1 hypothetical protein [Paraburkholderia fungorum]PNE59677.1 hypothetical protein A8H39_00570 [Paraburkholderia fungorum]